MLAILGSPRALQDRTIHDTNVPNQKGIQRPKLSFTIILHHETYVYARRSYKLSLSVRRDLLARAAGVAPAGGVVKVNNSQLYARTTSLRTLYTHSV